MSKDYYNILGVAKNASADEIKKAFRRLARQHHPDVSKQPGAEEKFKELNEAYQVLGDDRKRANYDQFGSAEGGFGGAGGQGYGGGGFEGFDFGSFQGDFTNFGNLSDIFETFFGGSRSQRGYEAERGNDLSIELSISLEEAAHGTEREVEISHLVKCAKCNGSGAKAGTTPKKCSTCGGAGQVRRAQRTILGSFTQVMPCPDCKGAGQTISNPCDECRGAGRTRQRAKIKIAIPAGIDNGYKLRIEGKGDVGPRGGSSGNLYAFINVKRHPVFRRDGADLYYKYTAGITQAALGDEIQIPTIDGEVTLKIPKGTQPSTTFRLREKGMPHLHRRERGDLYVLVEVKTPTHLNQKQEELLKEFAKSRDKEY
ncbi:MAG: molecular chaperone DnaJ [Candidatus Margulisiibacteriota bacterium]